VTFTILNGSGTQVVPPIYVNVVGGIASSNSILPAGTAVGAYTIQSVYDGTASFAASLPETSTLTISGSTTTTTAAKRVGGIQARRPDSVPHRHGDQLRRYRQRGYGDVHDPQWRFAHRLSRERQRILGYRQCELFFAGGDRDRTYTIQAVFTDPTNYVGSSDTSHTLTVSQPPATQLVIHTQPSSTATAGQAFLVQPVIYEEDQNGDLETGDNSTVVTVSLGSGAGPLEGTLTATVVGGVATFTNLADVTAETLTLTFSSGNLATASSTSIVVSPAVGSKLVVTQERRPRRRPRRCSRPSRSSRRRPVRQTSSPATAVTR